MIPEIDGKQFSQIMFGLAENYPGTNLSMNGIKMRFEALKEFSIDQVAQAATALLKHHRFNTMPTVGDFIRTIDEANGNIPVEDRAEIEAGKVITHLRMYGKALMPEFQDPVTRHLMSTRWRYCSWAAYVVEDDLKWWVRDFVRAYQAHAAGVGTDCLPGLPELKRLADRIGNFGKDATHIRRP